MKWTYSKTPIYDVPRAIRERFRRATSTIPRRRQGDDRRESDTISSKEQKLDAKGELKLTLDTDVAAGWPWSYKLEGDVTDVSRQQIAGRTSFRVDPAPWYIGVKTPPYFADAAKGIDTDDRRGGTRRHADAGRQSQRRAASHPVELASASRPATVSTTGTTERKEIAAGALDVTTQGRSRCRCTSRSREGGEYLLIATAKDAEGRSTTTRTWFYAVGGGYTAWERYDHNRIDLVPEKKTYKPGETARIMVKSPWEHATALLTTEREGVRTWKTFELTSTQQTISVPITEKDIPNVFVSVLLLKGRTKERRRGRERSGQAGVPPRLHGAERRRRDEAAEGRGQGESRRVPSGVEGAASKSTCTMRRQAVAVRSHAVGGRLRRAVADRLRDARRAASRSISRKRCRSSTKTRAQKIISRRVLTPKGRDRGRRRRTRRRAGRDPQRLPRARVLARLGRHRRQGPRAAPTITLPESLTTYRIMAVAGDKASRFGWAQNEIRINKPVLLTPTWPRFLAVGDKALLRRRRPFAAQAAGQGDGDDQVARSVDRRVRGNRRRRTIDVAAEGSAEVRFNADRESGRQRAHPDDACRMNGETDAFEDTLPVRILAPPETVAAYGEAKPDAQETLAVPKDVVPSARRTARRAGVDGDGRPRAKARRISSTIRTAARSSAPPRRWR